MASTEPPAATAVEVKVFTVAGFVREPDGTPIAAAVVSASDLMLRGATALGQTTTDAAGTFLIRYQQTALRPVGKTNADLVVKAAAGGAAIAQSAVMFRAPPAATVTLVRGNQPLLGPSQFTAVQAVLAPLLGDVAATELNSDDVMFLSGATGLVAGEVPHLAAAAQSAKVTGVDAGVFFALARQGMPTALTPLLASDPAAQRQALLGAVGQNLVPATLAGQAARLVAGLSAAAVKQTLAPGAFRLGGTLTAVLPQAAEQTAFLTGLQANSDDPAAFWTALATAPGFDAATLAKLQLASQLAALTQYHAPLVAALLARQAAGTIRALGDLARLDQADWLAQLNAKDANGAPIGVPPGVPGADTAIQTQTYATALRRRMEVAFPTIALTARLGASKLAGAAEIAAFLTANANFDIAATDANRYLAGKQAPAIVRSTLPAVQRLLRVAPSLDLIEPLLTAKLTSARAIARLPMARFVATYAGPLGGTATATAVYRQAKNVTGTAAALFGQYAAGLNRVGPVVIDGAPTAATPTAAAQVPNWSALFGTPDFCACTDCRSVLSPAAYMVDLLHEFLDPYLSDGYGNSGAALVLARRPDIGTMQLSCDNTNTTLPYIDLVNELLENAISSTVPPGTLVAHDSTEGAAADLGAAPEYINPAAYTIVGQAVFPWGLPFDLGLAQARAYLANLGVQRHALMRTFQPNPAAADPTDPTMTATDAVTCDYLGLSPLGWKLLLGTVGAQPWTLWGVTQADWQGTWTAAGGGPTVQAFLDQSGAAFQDLIDLLETRFAVALATPGAPWQLRWADGPTASCDPAAAVVINVSAAGLGLILRFLRLSRALGASVREFDALLGTPTAASLDAPLQVNVTVLDNLRRQFNLPFVAVAAWWGMIPTLPDTFGGTSLYQRLFLNPAVINPVDAAFGLNADGSELANTTHGIEDPLHEPTVLAGLQVVKQDLQLLLAVLPPGGAPGMHPLNLANVSALYRMVSLAAALSLSVSNFLAAAAVMGVSFAQSGAPATQRAPFDRTRAADARWLADQVALLTGAGIRMADLSYLLLDTPPASGGPAPASADIAQQLTTLAKALQSILTQHAQPDPAWIALGTSAVEGQLSAWLSVPVPALDALLGMTPNGFGTTMLGVLLDPGFVTSASPAAADVDGSLAAPVPANPAVAPPLYFQVRALVRLKKIAWIASRMALQPAEIVWLVANAAPLGWLDFNALPAANAPAKPPPLYGGFATLATLCRVRTQLTPGQPFVALLPPRPPAAAGNAAAYLATLTAATGWSPTDLQTLTGPAAFNIAYPAGFWDPAALAQLQACFTMLTTLRAAATQVMPWTAATLTVAQANDVVSLVKSGYAVAQWPTVGKSLRDPLRAAQRDALVAWLIANSQAAFGRSFSVPDDLFGQLLIDTQMSPCMQTSRLIQATQSLQLYVNRALMGLEPGVTAAPGAAQVWVSMQQYRLWQANREVFLYPENWLDPTLRDDKTDLFAALEQELHKSTVTKDSAETAFRHYLSGLSAMAHLRVCGMYHDLDTANVIDAVHVFARDHGTPPTYYWRQFLNASNWTQWQRVDLDIGGVDVVPVIYNRRLYVFWPIFKKLSAAASSAPVPMPGDANAPITPPLLWVQVQVAWSSYNEDKWAAKKVSDGPALIVPVSTPERAQMIQATLQPTTLQLPILPDKLLPSGQQPDVATLGVDPGCIRADGSVDPTYFTFKAIPPVPTDTEDTLRIECFIRSDISNPARLK